MEEHSARLLKEKLLEIYLSVCDMYIIESNEILIIVCVNNF